MDWEQKGLEIVFIKVVQVPEVGTICYGCQATEDQKCSCAIRLRIVANFDCSVLPRILHTSSCQAALP